MTAIAEETEETITPLQFGHKDDLPYTEADEQEHFDAVASEEYEAWLDQESLQRR